MSRKKRLAIFHNLNQGGAYNQLRNQLIDLNKYFHIDIYTTNTIDKRMKTRKFVDAIFYYKLMLPSNFIGFLYFIYFKLPKLHKKISANINRKKYDAILVQHDYLTKSPYLLRYLSGNVYYECCEPPREFYEISSYFYYDINTILSNILLSPIKYIDRVNVSKVNNIITISKYSRSIIKKIYKKSAHLIYPGIIYKENIHIKNKRKNIFLSVGAMNKVKGFDFLIDSISKTKSSRNYEFHIVGYKGNYSKKLLKLAKQKKVNLYLHYNVTKQELNELYLNSYLFLFASHKEPLGLVNLESMSYGLPTLVIDEGGVGEVIPFKNLLLKRCPERYAKRIDYFVKNKKLIKKYRKTLRNHSKKWDHQIMTKKLLKLLMN